MAAPNQPPHSDPFWDFLRALDPNAAAASGVDHNAAGPEFLRGFPFFQQPGGHHGHGPHGHGPHGHGPHGHGPHGRGRRGGRTPHGPHHPHHPQGPSPPHGPPHGWNTSPFGWGMWSENEWPQQDGQRGASDAQTAAAAAAAAAAATGMPAAGTRDDKADLQEKDDSPDTLRDDAPDPAEVTPDDSEQDTPPPSAGCRGRGPRRGGRHHHKHHHRGHNQPQLPFNLGALLSGLSTHPFVQNLQAQAQAQAQSQGHAGDDAADTFSPPLDLFETPAAYVLHLALPGAKKPDVGVDWNPDAGELRVAGVVHRPGDEAFLSTLVEGERRVGVFERKITLPPRAADKEEIDGDAITAKMEDGVLIVTVPKIEKEWTEIRKVDIE